MSKTRWEDGVVKNEQFWKVARQVEDALIYTDADGRRVVGDEENPLGEVRIDFELGGDPYTLRLLQRHASAVMKEALEEVAYTGNVATRGDRAFCRVCREDWNEAHSLHDAGCPVGLGFAALAALSSGPTATERKEPE